MIITPAGIVRVPDTPPALVPSPPMSTPTSTLFNILYITSLVKVNSPVIGPSIAQTVFPATGDPFVINSDSGQEPVRTLLLEPPVPPPPVGSSSEPNSPGEAIEVSPPPPHAVNTKIVVINEVFLNDLDF